MPLMRLSLGDAVRNRAAVRGTHVSASTAPASLVPDVMVALRAVGTAGSPAAAAESGGRAAEDHARSEPRRCPQRHQAGVDSRRVPPLVRQLPADRNLAAGRSAQAICSLTANTGQRQKCASCRLGGRGWLADLRGAGHGCYRARMHTATVASIAISRARQPGGRPPGSCQATTVPPLPEGQGK